MRVLGDAFGSASKPAKGGFVRDALSSGYPTLVAALETAFARLQQETSVKGVQPAVAPDQLPPLLAAVGPFRDAYLAMALGRVQDAVNTAFPGSSRMLPSPADVQKCIAVMHEELRAASASAQLATQVAAVVSKGLQLMAQRAELMAATGPELKALVLAPGAGSASPSQQRNIALASQLQEVHRWEVDLAHGSTAWCFVFCSLAHQRPSMLLVAQVTDGAVAAAARAGGCGPGCCAAGPPGDRPRRGGPHVP